MKILLVMNFETGDALCRYWQELAIVYCEREKIKEIEDSFSSYFENVDIDMDYGEIAEEILNTSGLEWAKIDSVIPECDCLFTIWI